MRILFSFLLFTFYFASTAQIPSYVPTNGLVGYWPFNGNANDESGNGNNGVVNGATLTSDRFGNVGSSYSFNGLNNHIEVPDANNLRLSNTDFTISIWVYHNSLNSNSNCYLSKRSITQNSSGYIFLSSNQVQNKYQFTVSNGCDPTAYSDSIARIGFWKNIIVSYKLAEQKIYFYQDGVLTNSTVGVNCNFQSTGGIPYPSSANNNPLIFGEDNGLINPYWLNGKLDDIAIYNRALTPLEITQLYTGQAIPSYLPTNGLVGYWPFCGNANDESGNGNNGVVNGATLTTDRFGNANGAYSFDGISSKIQGLSNPQLNINNNRTISVWFKSTSNIEEDQGIFGVSSLNTNGHNGYYFYLQSTGKLISLEDNWNGTTIGGPSNPTSGWSGAISNDSNYKNSNVWYKKE